MAAITKFIGLGLRSAIVRDPLVVEATTLVTEAIAQMCSTRTQADLALDLLERQSLDTRASCVLVFAESQLVGILTERDVVRLCTQQKDLQSLAVKEVMSSPVATLNLQELLSCQQDFMEQRSLRELVVIGDHGKILGIVTQATWLKVCNSSRIIPSETWYQKLANMLPGILYTSIQHLDGSVEFTYASAMVSRIVEIDVDVILADSSSFFNLFHPDDVAGYAAAVEHSITTQQPFHHEWRIITPSGKIKWLQVDSRPEFLGNQEILWFGVALDISDRKRAELELQQLNQSLEQEIAQRTKELWQLNKLNRTILDSSDYSIISTDLNGIIQSFNSGAEKMLGYSMGEIVGQVTPAIFSDAQEIAEQAAILSAELGIDIPVGFEVLAAKARLGIACEQEWTNVRKDGSRFPVSLSVTAMRDDDGEIIGFLGISRDITDRKNAETQLQELSDRLKLALKSGALGYWEWNIKANTSFWDERMCELYGISKDLQNYMTYETWANAIHPEDFPVVDVLNQKLLQGKKDYDEDYDAEFRVVHPDGTIRWIKDYAIVQRDAEGNAERVVGINLDISDRKLTEIALKRQLAAIEAAIDGIAILQDQKYIYLNHAHLHLFGYEHPEELIGKDWTQLYSPEEKSRLEQEIFPALAQARSWSGEAIATRKDGSTFNEGLSLTLTDDGLLICVCRDISDRKEAEAQLIVTNQQMRRVTRLKDEFLANMSHELRTPLNAILGITECLMDEVLGSLNPRQKSILQIVEKSGNHLLSLINDILDLSKVEAGKLILDRTMCNIQQLCDSSIVFIQQEAVLKNLQLEMQVSPDIPDLEIDERRIRQVLINLLNNAVKFTPEGGKITLRVTLEKSSESANASQSPSAAINYWVKFLVIDTGIGINAEALEHLFQPFVQIDSALNRKYDGTGLGLALVKRIVELHGGRVFATSEINVGSCFTVEIPCPNLKVASPQNISHLVPTSITNNDNVITHNPRLILLAEDNEANVMTVSNYLQAKGFRVIVAEDGQQAIALVQSEHPDLVLMDIQMPVMDGLEAIKWIRRNYADDLPIIALTALAMVGDREKCLDAGANDYLSKPIKLKQLTDLVQSFFHKPE